MELLNDTIMDTIKIESKAIGPCLLRVDYEIPLDQVKAGAESVTKYYAANVNIPGFRRGKVPASIARTRFKDQIEKGAREELISAAMKKTFQDGEKEFLTFKFADGDAPTLNLDQNDAFKFSIVFNVAPEIALPNYIGVAVEAPRAEITDAMVDDNIAALREKYGQFKKVEGPAKENDFLSVSYTSDCPAPADIPAHLRRLFAAEDNYIWLTQHDEQIPGVRDALLGAEAGKTYQHTAVFPTTHERPELAGKTVHYTIVVKEVQRKSAVESDTELLGLLRQPDMDTLKGAIRKRLEAETASAARHEAETCLLERLIDGLEFPLPPDLLREQTDAELEKILRGMVANGKDAKKEFEERKDSLRAEAEAVAAPILRRKLVLRRIAKIEKIEVDNNEIDSELKLMGRYLGCDDQTLRKRLINSGNIERVIRDLQERKVTDFLVDKAVITYVAPDKA